jgi:hypothetical protein
MQTRIKTAVEDRWSLTLRLVAFLGVAAGTSSVIMAVTMIPSAHRGASLISAAASSLFVIWLMGLAVVWRVSETGGGLPWAPGSVPAEAWTSEDPDEPRFVRLPRKPKTGGL